jgi:phage terminase small subunit
MDHFSTLTPKQALFCREYFKDFNATQAAIRAGYSQTTALNGHLMTLPKIVHHLQERGAAAAEEAQVTHKMVLAELKAVAMARVGDFFGADGKLLPINEVKEETRAALLNYTFTEDKRGNTTIKIRMNNKLSALDKIAKHLKFYEAEEPGNDTSYWIVNEAYLDEDDRYDDDSFKKKETEQEAEMNRRIAEAREQAIAETELRMKEEFKVKLKQVKKRLTPALSKGEGANVPNGEVTDKENTDKYPHLGEENQEARIKNQEWNMGVGEGAKSKEQGLAVRTLGEEEVIRYRVGDYTPEGHLIMQDASCRDKRSSRYNPDGGFYYIRKTGDTMFEKVFLPVKKAVA